MANIHGLDDLPARDIEVGSREDRLPPTLWDSVKEVLCPKFALYSVTSLIIATIGGLFVLLVLVSYFTGTPYNEMLIKCGAVYPQFVYQFEIHRLFVSIFLHLSFMHAFWNIITMFLTSYNIEAAIGRPHFLGLFFSAGVSGFLCSLRIEPSFTVGASGSIFGLFGIIFLELYYKRHQMNNRAYAILAIFLVFFVLSLLGSPGSNGWAHIGGLLFGGLYGIGFIPRSDAEPWHIAARTYAKVAVFAIPSLLLLSVLVMPSPASHSGG